MNLEDLPEIKRRRAAWCLRSIINHYSIGTQALTFDPDNPNEWAIDHCYVIAIKNQQAVADITMIEDVAQITINSIYRIIRDDKLDEFEPEQYGIHPRVAMDPITMIKRNDIEAEVDMPDASEFKGPAIIVPRTSFKKQPIVIKSLS